MLTYEVEESLLEHGFSDVVERFKVELQQHCFAKNMDWMNLKFRNTQLKCNFLKNWRFKTIITSVLHLLWLPKSSPWYQCSPDWRSHQKPSGYNHSCKSWAQWVQDSPIRHCWWRRWGPLVSACPSVGKLASGQDLKIWSFKKFFFLCLEIS